MNFRFICAFLVLSFLASCAGIPLTAKGECKLRGTPEGSAGYDACRESIRQEIAANEHQATQNAVAATAIIVGAQAVSGGSYTPSAGQVYYLTRQWFDKGLQMCQYGNGTVLNVGAKICPLSIQG